jgi:ABC-type sugar transport system permease subunit
MTKGGPGTASYIMGLYLYEVAFKSYNFGQASAISFVMFVIILLLTLINMKLKNKSAEGAI